MFHKKYKYNDLYYKDKNFTICIGPAKPGIQELTFHENTKQIANFAFRGEKSLEKITLPDNLEEIEMQAFEGCSNLKHVDLSATKIKTMPCRVFSESEIETIKLPKFLRTLDTRCFSYCHNLKKIDLPDTLRDIKIGAFAKSGLEEIKLPEDLKTIGPFAFANTPLEKAELNNAYGHSIFAGCENLKKVVYTKNCETFSFKMFKFSKVREVILPDTIKEIDFDDDMRKIDIDSIKDYKEYKKELSIEIEKIVYTKLDKDAEDKLRKFCGKGLTLERNKAICKLDDLIEEASSFKEINKLYKDLNLNR